MKYVVLASKQPREAFGPFRSRERAERLADNLRSEGITCEIIPLTTARDAAEFYGSDAKS